jgi:hypothetical protein
MRRRCAAAVLALAGLVAGVGAARAQDLQVPYVAPRSANTLVMLPDGSTVHVELAVTPKEKAYGLMGRTRLPEGRGMLFIDQEEKRQPYWMYHCKIGLDIVWMDAQHQIVEMSPDTPPCLGKANTCPSYGGQQPSQYVLELPVGDIARHHLKVGEAIEFRLN